MKDGDLPHATRLFCLAGHFPTACDIACPYPSHASSQGQSRKAQEDCQSLRFLQALQTKGTVYRLSSLVARRASCCPIVSPSLILILHPCISDRVSSAMETVDVRWRVGENIQPALLLPHDLLAGSHGKNGFETPVFPLSRTY